MIRGIYTSAAAMLPRTFQVVVESDNLANSNVPGHKRSNVFMRTLIDATQYLSAAPNQAGQPLQSEEVRIDFRQGPLVRTGDPLHVAIQGDGFFVIDTPLGPTYTRGGQFMRNADGELTTTGGYRVQGDNGPIVINGEDVAIQEDGTILVDGAPVDTLKVVDFPKPYPLVKVGNNTFRPSNPADVGRPATGFHLRQGYFEASNVRTVEAMVNMITLERSYESGQKSIQYQDETLSRSVNDLGRVPR